MQSSSTARAFLAIALSMALIAPATALDLKSAYLAALAYDAELLAARASLEESEAGVPAARAALLPQLAYSAQRNKAETNTRTLNSRVPSTDSGHYFSETTSLTIRQALFRKPAWDGLQAAKSQAEAADSTFQNESQNSGLRLVSAYLDVLNAREGEQLAVNATKAMEAWLALAEKSFKNGRGTRTDIEDAKARRDMSKAKETEAQMSQSSAAGNFEVLAGISAEKIPVTDPRRLNPELLLLNQQAQWLQRIEDESPELQSLRKQLEAARSSVAQAYGGHFPTVDLVAARQYSKSDANYNLGTAYNTDYIGVQINIPLISGGSVLAQSRQAVAREERLQHLLEATRRKLLAEGKRLYQAVTQGVEQVQALQQALQSSEAALLGERKGIQAGTRTFVDALDAERRMFESRRDHALAVYTLANNRMKFHALAGAMTIEAIETLSAWLNSGRDE